MAGAEGEKEEGVGVTPARGRPAFSAATRRWLGGVTTMVCVIAALVLVILKNLRDRESELDAQYSRGAARIAEEIEERIGNMQDVASALTHVPHFTLRQAREKEAALLSAQSTANAARNAVTELTERRVTAQGKLREAAQKAAHAVTYAQHRIDAALRALDGAQKNPKPTAAGEVGGKATLEFRGVQNLAADTQLQDSIDALAAAGKAAKSAGDAFDEVRKAYERQKLAEHRAQEADGELDSALQAVDSAEKVVKKAQAERDAILTTGLPGYGELARDCINQESDQDLCFVRAVARQLLPAEQRATVASCGAENSATDPRTALFPLREKGAGWCLRVPDCSPLLVRSSASCAFFGREGKMTG